VAGGTSRHFFSKNTPAMIPNRLFIQNRANLAAQLPPKSVAVFTANEPMPRNGDEFYPFRQQSDFFYLTGINEENAFLLLAA
jgi:Aminopeptidase P, N-terminal domain.